MAELREKKRRSAIFCLYREDFPMYNKKKIYEIALDGGSLLLQAVENQYANKHIWHTQRHCHASYELHIILEGSCRVEVEDREYRLNAGDALLILPGQYHQPLKLSADFARYNFSFTPDAQLLRKLRLRITDSMYFGLDSAVLSLCAEIFRESAAGNPYKKEQLHALQTMLIVRIFRLLQLSQSEGDAPTSVADMERVTYIDDYFENHFADNGGEEALARNMNLSKRQLARVLQKHYGMGYRQKLICARMDHAAWLLRTTDKRISRIAEEVGYVSESAFFQVFRRHFQMTPQQYRAWCAGNKQKEGMKNERIR